MDLLTSSGESHFTSRVRSHTDRVSCRLASDLQVLDSSRPKYPVNHVGFSVAAIIIQIKLAISNLEPKPARLFWQSDSWKRPYSVQEALEGYKRAASAHGWTASFSVFLLTSPFPLNVRMK